MGLFLLCSSFCATELFAVEPARIDGEGPATVVASSSSVDEGVMYHVPLVPVELQATQANATPQPGAGLQ
jgi:hypothetical protein